MKPPHDIGTEVMNAIRHGEVRMRPRWHFALLSALSLLGACIIFLSLLYVASLAFFLLRDSGAWYAVSFGGRGWFSLLHSLPWLLIALITAFIVVLELLVRRFAFVYKKPLVYSMLAIIALILFGGFALALSPLHRSLMVSARHDALLAPLGSVYGPALRAPVADMYHGRILTVSAGGIELFDENRGTTSVRITPKTRLPYGENFSVGERIVVVGDEASGTVRAFGIREIDEYPQESTENEIM